MYLLRTVSSVGFASDMYAVYIMLMLFMTTERHSLIPLSMIFCMSLLQPVALKEEVTAFRVSHRLLLLKSGIFSLMSL